MYRLAPVWCQNLLLTGFGALLERERYSGRYAEFRDMLRRTEWLPPDEIRAYQDQRLRAMVAHAYETVPFYRRRFDEQNLKPEDVRVSRRFAEGAAPDKG